jgi:hypothetical protein
VTLILRRTRLPALLFVALMVGCAGRQATPALPAPSTDSADATMRRGLSSALQARGAEAVAALRSIDPALLSPRYRPTRACMLDRLGARHLPAPALTDPFLLGLVHAYQAYWSDALTGRRSTRENGAALLHAVDRRLVAAGGRSAATLDSMESVVTQMVRDRGYHSLLGVTSPLRELMLWKEETEVRYEVDLPEGPQGVTVVFMDGFVSLGWAGFATCDRHHSGGWTTTERLFAVKSAYDTTTENFRVSYLAHEAQHFADTRRFPALEQQDVLEYRAKLAELSRGEAGTYDLIATFAGNVSDDVGIPHSYANGRVIRDMAGRLFPGATTFPWSTIALDRIRSTAVALLREDSTRR